MCSGILIVNKPSGWSSHDVAAKCRRLLKERRVGHGGTLDPMATGVLPIFSGRATRAAAFAAEGDKEYAAGLRLGLTTDTQDVTGQVLSRSDAVISAEELEAALAAFRGELLQQPPMYSALKQNGRPLYKLARQGIEVERAPRPISVYELELCGQEGPNQFRLRVVCSKGTYVRTLCHDIGQALGCGGVMDALCRTRAAAFTLQQAVTMEEAEQAARDGRLDQLLLPVETCFAQHPAYRLSVSQEWRCRNGNPFPVPGLADGLYRVFGTSGEFLMLGSCSGQRMSTVKSFFSV